MESVWKGGERRQTRWACGGSQEGAPYPHPAAGPAVEGPDPGCGGVHGPLRAPCSLCWLRQGSEGQASRASGPAVLSFHPGLTGLGGGACIHSPNQLWCPVPGSQRVLSARPQGRNIFSGRHKDVCFSLSVCLFPTPVSVPLSVSLSPSSASALCSGSREQPYGNVQLQVRAGSEKPPSLASGSPWPPCLASPRRAIPPTGGNG